MREGAHNERYGETAEHEVCASQSRPQLKYSRLYLSSKILLLVSWRALLPGAAFGKKALLVEGQPRGCAWLFGGRREHDASVVRA